MRKITLAAIIAMATTIQTIHAQDAAPTVTFYNTEDQETIEMTPGDAQSAAAPLDITCNANVDDADGNYTYICEWRIYKAENGENSPLLTRYDQDITYTMTESGSYGIKLYITFTPTASGNTIEWESEEFNITISESHLTCPDGFSPNGDGINDTYNISCESIVKVNGIIFNRWGKKLHTFTVDNITEGWDGMV